MCEPTTIMTVLSVASTVMGGIQARQEGKREQQIAAFNARNQENEAIKTRNKGVQEEIRERAKTAQLISRQRVQAAAGGLSLDSGTPLALQDDAALAGETDALRIRSNFQDQGAALDTKSQLTTFEGESARARGNNEFKSSLIGATGTGFKAAVNNKWFTPKSKGAPAPVTTSQPSFSRG